MSASPPPLLSPLLETSSNAAKVRLENSFNGVSCAEPTLTDGRKRNYKRQLLEEQYQCSIGALLLDDLQYIKRTPAGLVISVRPKGRIIDSGDKVTAEQMSDEAAARLFGDFGFMKQWTGVEFSGSPEFVRLAMIEAKQRGLKVIPRNPEQAAIWAEINAPITEVKKPMPEVKDLRPAVGEPQPVFQLDNAGILARLATRRKQLESDPGQSHPARKPFAPR